MGSTTRATANFIAPFAVGERVVVIDNRSLVCGYEGEITGRGHQEDTGLDFYTVYIYSDYYHGEYIFYPDEITRVYPR